MFTHPLAPGFFDIAVIGRYCRNRPEATPEPAL